MLLSLLSIIRRYSTCIVMWWMFLIIAPRVKRRNTSITVLNCVLSCSYSIILPILIIAPHGFSLKFVCIYTLSLSLTRTQTGVSCGAKGYWRWGPQTLQTPRHTPTGTGYNYTRIFGPTSTTSLYIYTYICKDTFLCPMNEVFTSLYTVEPL